ncbi:MAG: ParB/RepB/Spo0J family partition protein [Sterolibacterium sp.]
MNAPATTATLPVALPVESICASPTNPRKHFDQAKLNDLANSIQKLGVLQPILTRPLPACNKQPDGVLYEIVCGERRWRAAKLAGLVDIPAFWRELGDQEVLEIQIVENLQREDVHPLEEAEGYERLMKDYGYQAEQLGDKIGKSKAYIYARLKLTALCPAARKAFYADDLNPSTALLVARIPVAKLQEQATKEIAHGRFGNGEPMSYRIALDHVQRTYMLRLADAPFSRADENLVPGVGRCHECPKRTGNQQELFADVKNADICTDPECFESKKLAHVAAQKAAAKAEGRKIIDGAEAKKIKPNSYNNDLAGGYVDLDKKIYSDSKNRTMRQILGKDAPKPDLLIDPHDKGKVIEVIAKSTIEEHLAAKGVKIPSEVTRQARSAEEKEAARKQKQEVTFRQRLFESIRSKLTIDFDTRAEDALLDLREFRLVTTTIINGLQFEDQKRLARLWIAVEDKTDDHELVRQLKDRIDSFERKDCARLMIEASIAGQVSVCSYSDTKPIRLLDTAEALQIDAAAIKKGVIAESKAKEKPKAASTAAKKSEPKKVQAKTAKVQPAAASSTTGEPKIGDRVLIKNGLKGPSGHRRKCCGKTGTIDSIQGEGAYFTVRLGPKARDVVTNLVENEFIRMEDAASSNPPVSAIEDPNVIAAGQAARMPWPFPTGTSA